MVVCLAKAVRKVFTVSACLRMTVDPLTASRSKIGDGDGKRGGHPAVIEALRQLGLLGDEALSALASYRAWSITNHRGLIVGEVRANFVLKSI